MLTKGQILWWIDSRQNTRGTVEVAEVYEECFVVKYNGKLYKRPYSVLGEKLFFKAPQTEAPSCEKCFLRYAKTCTSLAGQVCDDYRPRQQISKEEIASWPEYGDATALRKRDYQRFHETTGKK